ncbi:CARDB domain-containing protein [Candidatus Poribacteria bacterium]
MRRLTIVSYCVLLLLHFLLVSCGKPVEPPVPPFLEEYPAWNTTDLAVTNLTVEPDRANPGDQITLRASVSNTGSGAAANIADLVFLVDDEEIHRVPIEPLEPGSGMEAITTWTAEGPGRHSVLAELEFGGTADRSLDNNLQTAVVRLSGETDPVPELEFRDPDLGSIQLIPGESYTLNLKVRNPSFAHISNIPVTFFIDGEDVPLGDDIVPHIDLAPGEEQEFQIPWNDVTPGEHLITVNVKLPDGFPDPGTHGTASWYVQILDKTVLYNTIQKDKWVSIGPRILVGGGGGLPQNSVGRMDSIAFHPSDPNIIYAGAPAGGLWKTINGGASWTPLGDKWPSLRAASIAVDPKYPQVIYVGTGSSLYKGGVGFFKSIDHGVTWTHFATSQIAKGTRGASELAIRYTSSGKVMLYASTDLGVLRYKSSNPKAQTSTTSEWDLIRTGIIHDMAVSPNNSSLVYASVDKIVWSAPLKRHIRVHDGFYRTVKGENATGNSDWEPLKTGLPNLPGNSRFLTLDIYKGDPKILYASITNPLGVDLPMGPTLPRLGIYKSVNEGKSWSLVDFHGYGGLYNPFIRVDPLNSNLVYFGGVKLYMQDTGSQAKPVLITGIHDDMKIMEFDPHPINSGFYYILSDGGIWRCKSGSSPNAIHRNYDLRTTMFYDFDVSPTNSNIMIGGTQDNGTILYHYYTPLFTWVWRVIRGGDGLFSVIASANNLYSQHQFLRDLRRSDDGILTNMAGEETGGSWKKANNGLPTDNKWGWSNAYITVHPNSPYTVLSQGDQVYATDNGGSNWTPRGPDPNASNVKGHITRVVVQPNTFTWIAGNSKGQLWYTTTGKSPWHLLGSFEHPDGAGVKSMAFAPTDHKILYVTFHGGRSYLRIWRLEMNPGPPESWSCYNITDNFPTNLTPQIIAGDGHTTDKAYVGTEKGVYCWTNNEPTWKSWQPYNDGLPLADVRDLLVDPTSKQLRAATYGRGAWSTITGP